MTDYKELVRYPVIEAAIQGDVEAVNAIVDHYQGYINSLSIVQITDDKGNRESTVDTYLARTLELHLVTAILKFKI